MSKQPAKKKLQLARQTLRRLDGTDLARVAGGAKDTWDCPAEGPLTRTRTTG